MRIKFIQAYSSEHTNIHVIQTHSSTYISIRRATQFEAVMSKPIKLRSSKRPSVRDVEIDESFRSLWHEERNLASEGVQQMPKKTRLIHKVVASLPIWRQFNLHLAHWYRWPNFAHRFIDVENGMRQVGCAFVHQRHMCIFDWEDLSRHFDGKSHIDGAIIVPIPVHGFWGCCRAIHDATCFCLHMFVKRRKIICSLATGICRHGESRWHIAFEFLEAFIRRGKRPLPRHGIAWYGSLSNISYCNLMNTCMFHAHTMCDIMLTL